MNEKTISFQREFCQALPYEIKATVDYTEYCTLFNRISELIDKTKIADELYQHLICDLSKKQRKQRAEALHALADQIIRLSVGRKLREESLRDFTCSLAESVVLQHFCRLVEFGTQKVYIPGKSSLCEYEKMIPSEVMEKMNDMLIKAAATEEGARTVGLTDAVTIENCYLDTTCLETNIHYPVDWILLRDGTRSLMKAVITIRKRDLKVRMPKSPTAFMKAMNTYAMQMSYAARQKDGKKRRKYFFRKMKKLLNRVAQHGERHRDLLEERWQETDLSEGEKNQIIKRINTILDQLPEVIKQSHKRIISEKKIQNNEKILSLYETATRLIVRKKAGKEVEFGNVLSIIEQKNGLIIDYKLYEEKAVADANVLPERIDAVEERFGEGNIKQLTTDRGFNSKANKKYLAGKGICDNTCPRSVEELHVRTNDEVFMVHQKRRSQTEARIGIFKNVFLGKPFRNKGFEYRNNGLGWCVLAHNLWVLARLPQEETVEKLIAA